MSIMSNGLPAVLILSLAGLGIAPKGKILKNALDLSCITAALVIGLPGSLSIFPPVSRKSEKSLEEAFHNQQFYYFAKGL